MIDLLEHESYLDYNSIPLYEGNNLISFWALPWENSVEDIFGDMQYVLSVAGEALISTYDDGNWSGSLETINRNSGYWVTVSDDEVLNVFGIASETDLGYSLDNYKNLISFPSPIQTSITDAIPDNVENSFLGIIGQGSAAQLINSSWEGTLEYFEGTNGYWALINDPIEFNFIIDGSRSFSAEKNNSMIEISNQFQYNISMNQAFYFIDNIYLENKPLEENHIIITYCNDNIVGSRVWNKKIIDQPAMGYDGTEKTIGYCYDGQIPNFKLYNPNTNKMIQLDPSVQFEWSNNTFYNINLSSSEIISNPNGFTIENIYPNPFNGNISINYTIQKPGNFSVEIIDLNGRLIEFIEKNSFHDIGAYYSNWDSGINSSGTYFVKIMYESKNQNIIQKLMLIK